jgi:antitoxin HicB
VAHLYNVPSVLTVQPEGGYTITSRALPALITEEDTVEEALAHGQEALAAVVKLYEDPSQPLPAGFSRAIDSDR